ncbi:MAG: response regulator, partial [Candidatus Rokubacteria bacterium]|nr:response regulator [Candidatus Rokubacteria bacterium]
TADSVPGRGAVFTVELPAAPPARSSAPGPGVVPASALLPALRRGHVLVVEDEEAVAIVMKDMLSELGQEATVARDIVTAWDLLASDPGAWDVVTLDVRMPGGSGKDLYSRLMRDLSIVAKRVIFVTGDTADTDTQRFLTMTGCPVLTKPVGFATLASVLVPLLGA